MSRRLRESPPQAGRCPFFGKTERFKIFIKSIFTELLPYCHKERVTGIHKSLRQIFRTVAARLPALLIIIRNLNTAGAGICCIEVHNTLFKSRRNDYRLKYRTRLICIAYIAVSPLSIKSVRRSLFCSSGEDIADMLSASTLLEILLGEFKSKSGFDVIPSIAPVLTSIIMP